MVLHLFSIPSETVRRAASAVRGIRLPAWAVLVLATGIAFYPAVGGSILSWDDARYLDDPAIGGTTLFLKRLAWIFSTDFFANYNPLHRCGNWIQLALLDRSAACFHLVSILLHGTNACLVFILAMRLRLPRYAGLVAALLFAVHPSRAEVVGWFSAQKDLGSTLFAIAGLVLYAPLLVGQEGRRPLRLLGVWVAFVLALLYKSMLVTYPILLLILDLAWGRSLRRALPEKIPFFLASFVFACLTVGVGARPGPTGGDWETHFATTIQAPWFYIRHVLWPVDFSGRWWVERPPSIASPAPVLAALLALGFVAGCAVLLRGRRPRIAILAPAWPIACLLPVSNLIPIPIVVADRYLYLALLGPCLAVGFGLKERMERAGPTARAVFGSAISLAIIAFVLLSNRSVRAFGDDETLWRTSLRAQPENPAVRILLAGEILARRPDADGGREALEVLGGVPDGHRASQKYFVILSRAFRAAGRDEEAESVLDIAVIEGLTTRLTCPVAIEKARRLEQQGLFREARRILDACPPRFPEEEVILMQAQAQVCLNAVDYRGYMAWSDRLLARQPFSPLLWHNRQMVARQLGLAEEVERCAAAYDAIAGPGTP
jgi:protein O-mannosyl-transferase